MTDPSCPVSTEKINENAARLVAFVVLLLSVIYILTGFIWIFVLLSFDFFIRGFTTLQISPLKQFVKVLASVIPIKNKPVDAAPKKFAAKLGFIMSLVITALYFAGFISVSIYISYGLVLFASLESLAAVCVGCYIYDYTQRLFPGLR